MINLILGDTNSKIEYIPLVKLDNKVILAEENQKAKILSEFYARSAQILQPDFVKKEYAKFAEVMFDGYLKALHGKSLILRIINKLFKQQLVKKMYSKGNLVQIKNYIECEAHSELLLKGLSEKIGK